MPIQFPFLSAFTAKKPDYTRDLFFKRRFQSSAGIDCYNGHVLNFPGSDFPCLSLPSLIYYFLFVATKHPTDRHIIKHCRQSDCKADRIIFSERDYSVDIVGDVKKVMKTINNQSNPSLRLRSWPE